MAEPTDPPDPFDWGRLQFYFGLPEDPQTGNIDFTILRTYAKVWFVYCGDAPINEISHYIPQTAADTGRMANARIKIADMRTEFQNRTWGHQRLIKFVRERAVEFDNNAPQGGELYSLPRNLEENFWQNHVVANGEYTIIKESLATFRDLIDIPAMLADPDWLSYWVRAFMYACKTIYMLDRFPGTKWNESKAGQVPAPLPPLDGPVWNRKLFQNMREILLEVLSATRKQLYTLPYLPPKVPPKVQPNSQS